MATHRVGAQPAAPNSASTTNAAPSRHRRSIRLPYYDYAQGGGYFLTICTHERRMLFENDRIAAIVTAAWEDLPNHHPNVELDEFVIMPNHVHGILILRPADDRAQQAAPLQGIAPAVAPGSLSVVVRSFKARVTRDVRAAAPEIGEIWQRNYHEHVIRNEAGLRRIRHYTHDNPARWAFDHENPVGLPDQAEDEFERWLERQPVKALQ